MNPSATFADLSSNPISIFSDDISDFGDYLITITGSLPIGKSASTSFTLKMKDARNTPPYFTQTLNEQSTTVGKKLKYKLPEIKDD